MLTVGIILVVLGLAVMRYSLWAFSPSSSAMPGIRRSLSGFIIINSIWVGLLVAALIILWTVDPIIVVLILGGFIALLIIRFFRGTYEARARRIIEVYRQLKLHYPDVKDEEILRETARVYFKGLRWDKDRIDLNLRINFEERVGLPIKDVKGLARAILLSENVNSGLELNFDAAINRLERIEKIIDEVYQKVMGETDQGS